VFSILEALFPRSRTRPWAVALQRIPGRISKDGYVPMEGKRPSFAEARASSTSVTTSARVIRPT
jgi:hypothetical protein